VARAAVAPALSRSTVHAVVHLSMRTTAGAVAMGVLKGMAMARLKALIVFMLTLGSAAIAGIGLSLPSAIAPALAAQEKGDRREMAPADIDREIRASFDRQASITRQCLLPWSLPILMCKTVFFFVPFH
jgi:hypothetical protein